MHCVLFSLWIALLSVVGLVAWALGSRVNGGPKFWSWVARACAVLLVLSFAWKLFLSR